MTEESVDIAIPVLPSSNPAATVALWQGLGFEDCQVFAEAGYGIARSGCVEFHFYQCDDEHVCHNTSCYIRVTDADAWHARLAPKIAAPARVSEALLDREWGLREFYIWDADGVLYKFGQVLSEQIHGEITARSIFFGHFFKHPLDSSQRFRASLLIC